MTVVPPPPPPTPAPEHADHLALAQARFKPIRKALAVAGFNGWTAIAFASLTLLISLASALLGSPSLAGFLVGTGILAGGVHELIARSRLQRLDPRALPRLAWNQALFASVIVLYCLWSFANVDSSIFSKALAQAQAQVAQQTGTPLDESMTTSMKSLDTAGALIIRSIYALIAFLTILIESLLAWYYLAKRKHLWKYLRETPPWAKDMQRRGLLR